MRRGERMDGGLEGPTTKNVKNSGQTKNGQEWMMRGRKESKWRKKNEE